MRKNAKKGERDRGYRKEKALPKLIMTYRL